MASKRHLEHLPPGARPGPQSQRRGMNVRAGGCIPPLLAVAAVLSLVVFGGVALLLGSLSSGGDAEPGGPDPAWLWVAALGGAAVLLGVAFVLWRKAHPRRDTSLSVDPDRRRARRGEEVRVTVAGIGQRAATEVALGCTVHWDMRHHDRMGGAGYRMDRLVAENVVWRESTQASPSGEARLRLPVDQPYSHEGHVVSFAWTIDARTLVDGQRGRPSAPAAVWVDP